MFSLTIAQAAATLASTLVGYRIGLFGDQIVNAVLLVVLISLLVTSIGTGYFSARVQPETILLRPVGNKVVVPVMQSPALENLMAFAADNAYADSGVVMPVVVVPEHEQQASRPIYEKLLLAAEECGTAAGADVEGVLRIDSSEHMGVVREIDENRGSLLVIGWSYNPNLNSYVFGDRIDRLGAASPIPVVAVRFAPHPMKRLLLASGADMGSTAYRADLQVAQEIVRRMAPSKNIPLQVLLPEGKMPAGLELPDKAEIVPMEPGRAAIKAYVQPGDVLVVPVALIRRLVASAALEFSEPGRFTTLVIAAGPHRLNITSARAGSKTESIINLAADPSLQIHTSLASSKRMTWGM
jgi:nucleotide-binding universal stress UspA family protein